MTAAIVQAPVVDFPTSPQSTSYAMAKPAASADAPEVFNAAKHLAYSPPPRVLTMKDLALDDTPLSSFASTDPFPLLSYEAVLEHRRELFTPKVVDNCYHQTLPGAGMLRGMAQRYTPFIQSFWNSPEVLKIVSDIAGVDLVPAMNYEICHTNIQLGPDGREGVKAIPVVPPPAGIELSGAPEGQQNSSDRTSSDNNALVKWHKDSHPFVCVVMLSDARSMEGGETVLMGGDGRKLSVKAPQMGSAVILQGRYISHVALPATNMPERITIVTSFRPRDPSLVDETTHKNVRGVSQSSELYYQWSTYRLDNLAHRATAMANAFREKYAENCKNSDEEGKQGLCRVETVNYEEMKCWVEEQIKFLQSTIYEMRPL